MGKIAVLILILISIAMILATGCTSSSAQTSTSQSFIGEWQATDMSAYYSIRDDRTWSYGDYNNDGSRDEITHGTYTVDSSGGHFIAVNDQDHPFDLIINDTGYMIEHGGYPGTPAYNTIIAYSKVSDTPGPSAAPTSTVSSNSASLSQADIAVASKENAMLTYASPLMISTGQELQSGDYVTARENAVSIQNYIATNLPELQQLANNADTLQPAAQEAVLAFTEMGSGAGDVIKGIDYYNAGDTSDATTTFQMGTALFTNATTHLQNAKSLTP